MKIETYHSAYDQLTECAREAAAMNQTEVQNMIEQARARLHQAWDRLVELETNQTAEKLTDDPQP